MGIVPFSDKFLNDLYSQLGLSVRIFEIFSP